MTPFERPDRCCPRCEHKGYMFRARKSVDAPAEQGGKQIATKYRCRSCSHEWWEQVPAPPQVDEGDAG